VPTVAHYEVAKSVMEKNIHVLIEKPVTKTVDEAEELLKIAAKRNLVASSRPYRALQQCSTIC